MNDEIITIEVEVEKKVDVDIHVSDVMYALNRLPLKKKWNTIAGIITNLKLTGKDMDGDEVDEEDILTADQKVLIKTFLTKQIALL